MPRAVVASNVLLLWCASVLLGAGLSARWSGAADPTRPLPSGWLVAFSLLAVVTALVFLGTEWFSGIRWVAVIAAGAAGLAIAGTYFWDLSAGGVLVLWLIAWLAVAYWFAQLTSAARADR